jgi:pyruvate formate lyase activating enzyme
MQINGYISTSFIDWPGHTAAVLFTPGCNLACGFCHNRGIHNQPIVSWEDIKEDLQLHQSWIYGVVITGGEPTIHFNLPLLVSWIRAIPLRVKLDTNGTSPYALKNLLDRLDYVAMDFKAPYGAYNDVCGAIVDVAKIQESMHILVDWGGQYEFRTTLLPNIHNESSIAEMAKMLPPGSNWVLQQFNPNLAATTEYKSLAPYPYDRIKRFQEIAISLGINCSLRV